MQSKQPDLIRQIEALLNITLHPAPSSPTPQVGLMTFKKNCPKYLLDAQGKLIGLNLAATSLNDEQWQQVVSILEKNTVSLQALNLCDNQLKQFIPPPGVAALAELDLDDNPLEDPPPEIVKQGNAAMLRYVQAAVEQGVREAFEVKMLIVGEGETGKTTLWNLLQNPAHPVPDERQKSTVGIQITEGWTFPHRDRENTSVSVNLWDFGGQEIQYMTHQFFLTCRSFYVLLADNRREAANFSYWLDIISLLGRKEEQKGRLPVLVVINEKKSKNPSLPYDSNTVQEQYPGLEITKRQVDFADKADGRLDALNKKIKEMLCREISHLPLPVPKFWDAVREELKTLRTTVNHITHQQFVAICTRHGILDRQQQASLSQFLHDLGFILHFNEPGLADFVVLNPSWAVNAVYAILEHEDVEYNQGRFNRMLLQTIWTNKGFTAAEQDKLINLMLKDGLEICFRAKEQGEEIYIAPQLLPEEAPQNAHWQDSPESLRYIYHYPFMPKGIIGRLIVRLHEDIEGCGEDDACGRDCRKMVWKNGAVLHKNDCRTRIRFIDDRTNGRELIKIEVQGTSAEDRKYVLRDICNELGKINKDFKGLHVFEKIPCCCEECGKSVTPHEYDRADLERMKSKGIEDMRCMESGCNVLIRQLEKGVFPNMEGRGLMREPEEKYQGVVIHNHLPASLPPEKKPWYKRWYTYLAGVIGFLGSIASIASLTW
jgi:GTPase SAR1 family protein